MAHYRYKIALLLITCALATACAQKFPRPESPSPTSFDGHALFQQTLYAHGGEKLDDLEDVSINLSGDWKFLITRIQPLVTDYQYRVDSEERLLIKQNTYSALYRGPAGTKKVVRTPWSIRVFYNDEESFDDDVLKSSALTGDAFFMFLLGPLALADKPLNFIPLADISEKGRSYHRLYAKLQPGFGYAEMDEVVLWIDTETKLTSRMHITLEGFKTTKRAHVDVSFLDYQTIKGFILPSQFEERVIAPIGIKAHTWQLRGLDINRGLTLPSVDGPNWGPKASPPATPLNN